MKFILVVVIILSLLGLGAIPAENVSHKVTLKWNKPVGNWDGINVYRQDCNGYVLLKSLGKVLTAQDTAVIGGQTISYYVTTMYQGTESKPSPVATTTIPY